MWEVRQRGLDVGFALRFGQAPEEIWRAAAERNVDLIVLPESLFDYSTRSVHWRSGAIPLKPSKVRPAH